MAFAIGGRVGSQDNTHDYPWSTPRLSGLVHGADPTHRFSSCALLQSVMQHLHKDRGNEPGALNMFIACSRWRGGQVWASDGEGSGLGFRVWGLGFTGRSLWPWSHAHSCYAIHPIGSACRSCHFSQVFIRVRKGFVGFYGASWWI